jgi:hypothetical protein
LLIQEEQEKKNPLSLIFAMITSKKTIERTAKRDETVIPEDDHRVGIGIDTIPEPGELRC